MRRYKPLAAVLVVLLTSFGTGWAATIYVDVNNATGTEDGSQQFPYVSLQQGINMAASGDSVSVAAGVYNESIALKDGVSVFGAGAGLSILDGGSQTNSVVSFIGVRQNPRFEGFTIRNGRGDQIGTIGNVPIFIGGGIKILDSGPKISNNLIENNTLDVGYTRGGGIYINTFIEHPSIIGNTIRNNTARSMDVPGEGRGGGIYIVAKSASVLITENVIDMNVSDVGGGVYNKNLGNVSLMLERNNISYNEATDGAAIYTQNFTNSSATIVNNLFVGNGSTAGQKDCNDTNGASSPGGVEICNDGIDNDCDPLTPDIFDADNDGFTCDVDCNDSDPTIYPGGFEHCGDMVDNDCDGAIDFSNPDNIVLVEFGSGMTYLANEVDPALAQTWVETAFDDASWTIGTYGVGYEDSPPGATNLLGTTVNSGTSSIYTRTLFDITDKSSVNFLFLAADFDDGYGAWINGVEIYRSPQMPTTGDFDWNTAAMNGESSNGPTPNYGTLVDVSAAGLPALVNGTNVLAVGVWNDLNTSDDLVLVPRLSMSFGPDDTDCLCGDADGDFYSCVDCDDTVATTNPAAPEVCNDGIDNDCNAATPDVFDNDGDSFNCVIDCDDDTASVNPGAAEIHCDGIDNDCNPGTPDVVDNDNDGVDCTLDCNDDVASIFPGQIEFCFDGVDNNCDGFIDDMDLECSCNNPIDADLDGFRCTDCNDGNPAINPGAVEICNDGIDNDCEASTLDIFDGDQDGENCDTDCQDFNPLINAAAIEICNDGIDNDCDTLIDLADPDCAGGDADNDGYDSSVDCDDGDPAINPGAVEICNDGIDNDCNPATLDLSDSDGDGYDCITDCDDSDPSIHPGVPENCADLIDNDCDGFIDAVNPDLVLIEFGSEMKYLANQSDPGIGIAFSNVVFNDASWNSGIYGVGYQFGVTGSGVQDLAATTVPVGTVSVYTRAQFQITAIGSVNGIFYAADYDDAYVVWVNGTEVHRSPEMPAGVPTWDADPALHESSNGQVPDYGTLIDITSIALPLLQNGTNLLAVAIYNNIPDGGGNSSDLIIVPRLSLNFGDDDPDCVCPDLDNDGYSCSDCDDTNPLRNPGLTEIGCDGIDNDCDAGTDDIFDGDNDGFDCDVDCNDNDPNVFPGAIEIPCDFVDNDCDAATFDIFDLDLDGYDCQFDCDESDPNVNPGMPEIGCDGIDNDCDPLTLDVDDADSDTYRCDQDCDDMDPLVNPGAFEKCDDGIDNDCDGDVDGADSDCTCADLDGDGYQCQDCDDGDPAINPAAVEICDDGIDNDCNPATIDIDDVDGDGFDCLADCDDTNPFIRPNAAEICDDGIDNDCNPATLDIVDNDGDGFTCDVDCNDNDPAINPGMTELCNDTIDNDCNPSTVDIGDLDFDGVICTFDCDDGDNMISPNLPEICNDGIDNDCNPTTPDVFDADGDGTTCDVDCDDMDSARGQLIAEKCNDGIDNDCDGDVDGADSDCSCGDVDLDGYSCTDCNDNDPAINPGAIEVCNDGIDNDCNPATPDVGDLDNDGFLCTEDCDDQDPLAFPSGQEICNDGIDNDCNPATPDLIDADSDTYLCDVDCDDNDPLINPGQPELGCDGIDNDCDPMTSDLADFDMDGFTCVDGSVRGGAITVLASSPTATVTVVNNTFYNNAMPSGIGGAIYVDDLDATGSGMVANNVFFNNQAELGGGIVHTFFYGDLNNNDFSMNTPGDFYDAGGSGMSRRANLFVDPQLSSTSTANYRLAPGSPLIDAGDPTLAPTNDFDRIERPYDGDGDMTALPDIGAFEWPSGEVLNLMSVGPDAFVWQVEDPDDVYNVYRASLGNLKNTGNYTQPPLLPVPEQFCEFPASALPFGDGYRPPNGVVAYYLVTHRGFAVEGSLGTDWNGVLRLNAFPCP